MCILLGAIFEISFEVAMNTAKTIIDNNITLIVHSSQLGIGGLLDDLDTSDQIKEFMTLNDTCLWTSTNEDRCINDGNECFCIKSLAERASKRTSEGSNDITLDIYEEMIKVGLLREAKYAIMKSYLTQQELSWGDQYNQGMGWHRSEERIFGINPYRGYLANKKWIYNEDITILFSFCIYLSSIKKGFLGIFCLSGVLTAKLNKA